MKKAMFAGAVLLAFGLNGMAQDTTPQINTETTPVPTETPVAEATAVSTPEAVATPAVEATSTVETNTTATTVVTAAAVAEATPSITDNAANTGTAPTTEKKCSRPVKFDLAAGMSYWDGDVTYEIGGEARDAYGTYYLDDPLSKLKFPLNIAAVNVDASLLFWQMLEVYGGLQVAVTEPNDKVEDSDWSDGVKDIYSESDCDVDAWSGDAGVRWWFNSKPCKKTGMTAGIAPAIGYKQQSLDWDVKNLDQWYPTEPNEPHDVVDGKVMTYDYDMDMLYVGAKAYLRHRRFMLTASGGVSAYMNMEATDDHLLRQKKSTSDFDGNAYFVEGEGRFYMTKSLYLLGRVNYMYAKADGTQKQHYYGGYYEGWEGEIDSKITSKQLSGTVAIGYEF